MASPTRPHGLTTCNNRRRRLSIPTDKYNKKRNYLPASALEPGAWAWQRRRSFVYKCRGAGGSWLDAPKERQWPSGSGSDAMQSNGAARKIYKNTIAHTWANTGSRWTHMQHGRWLMRRGVGEQRTLDTGHWQLATHAKILPVGRPGNWKAQDPRTSSCSPANSPRYSCAV